MRLSAPRKLMLLFGCLPLVTVLALTPAQRGPTSESGFYVMARNVMVPMRDRTRLATDIYFPAKDGVRLEGKFPAILERTPYNKDSSAEYLVPFTTHGYVVVTQDTRGRYASEGVWHMMSDDGFGMIGTSYVGGTQHAMAESETPGLKALIPVDAVSNAGYFGLRNGGT